MAYSRLCCLGGVDSIQAQGPSVTWTCPCPLLGQLEMDTRSLCELAEGEGSGPWRRSPAQLSLRLLLSPLGRGFRCTLPGWGAGGARRSQRRGETRSQVVQPPEGPPPALLRPPGTWNTTADCFCGSGQLALACLTSGQDRVPPASLPANSSTACKARSQKPLATFL